MCGLIRFLFIWNSRRIDVSRVCLSEEIFLSWDEPRFFILKRAASYVPIQSFEEAFYVQWNAIELNLVFVKEFGGNRNPIHFRINPKPVVASTD